MSSAPDEVRRTVTILFADIVASTELGERLDPEALRRVVSRYFDEMARVLEAHGGTVEKFIGDEVMAVFGVPTAHEDDALRAVRAAVAMREALANLNEELQATWDTRLESRIAINTGEVVAGDASAGHGFVSGEAVTLTKRIQTAAAPGEILMGDATHALVCHAVRTTAAGPLRVKGKREPVAARRLEDVDLASEAFVRRLDAPLVGRAAEVARLLAAYEDAVTSRRPQLVTILGPAGIGKSRLVRELLDRVAGEAETLAGRCLPYGDGITFWPIREILPDERFEGTTEEIFWRVRTGLEAHAGDRPLVVCFEDVHWGEPTFLDLVQYLWGWMREHAVVFVCAARPELLERRPDWPQDEANAGMLSLGPLSHSETKELLDSLEVPAVARDGIAEAADGNPLFVEQMAAMAADEGGEVPTPPSIRSLLAARLGRLERDELAILERASVIGRDFPLRAVLELTPEQLREDASAVLLGLVRKELVRPHHSGPEDGFRFKHVLIRDAVYEGMSKQTRADLHERHADWLQAAGHSGLLVGYHLEQSVLLQRGLGSRSVRIESAAARAGELLGDAGGRAFRRGDMPAARTLFERALALLPADAEAGPRLRVLVASAMWQTGDVASADALLESVLDDARRSGDQGLEWSTRLELATRRAVERAGAIELEEIAEQAIPIFEELGETGPLARAHRALGIVAIRAGRYGDAEAHLARVLADPGNLSPTEHARAADALCTALLYGPATAAAAVQRCRELLAEGRENLVLEANVASSLSGLVAMLGEFDEARALYRRAREVFTDLGLRMPLAGLTQVTGALELLAQDPVAAERELRLGLEILEEAGVGGGPLAPQAGLLAHALVAQGRVDEARELVVLAEKATSDEDLPSVILTHTARARLETAHGDPRRGAAAAHAAIAVAKTTDALNLTADACVALAGAHLALDQREPAAEARAAALDLYRAKGNLAAESHVSAEALFVTEGTR